MVEWKGKKLTKVKMIDHHPTVFQVYETSTFVCTINRPNIDFQTLAKGLGEVRFMRRKDRAELKKVAYWLTTRFTKEDFVDKLEIKNMSKSNAEIIAKQYNKFIREQGEIMGRHVKAGKYKAAFETMGRLYVLMGTRKIVVKMIRDIARYAETGKLPTWYLERRKNFSSRSAAKHD